METIWIVGASDDHLEAAFATEAEADAYLVKIRERDGISAPEMHPGRDGTEYPYPSQDDFWWVAEIPLAPEAPAERNPLQGLGGLGA